MNPFAKDPMCESCGLRADVRLKDDSTWCNDCHGAARIIGYDTEGGTPIVWVAQ